MTRRRQDYYGHAHDERVEPHQGLDPHMPDPDWGGVIVHPDQKKMPVGDPTLWANTITTVIDADPTLGSTPRVINGDQIILAQAADRYSRSWSLIGNVQMPVPAWADDVNPTPPNYSAGFDVIGSPIAVWLSITQGIEKVTIEQQILLASGGTYGLCANQLSGNGGPYALTFNQNPPLLSPTLQEIRSFAAIGSLIGNTISVRAIFTRGGIVGQAADIPNATVSLLITPYAPGQGI